MKRIHSLLLALAAIACCGAIPSRPLRADYTPPASSHLDLNFNYDWKFIKEDVKGGAQAAGFDDSSWSNVSLPHTWNDDKFRNWWASRPPASPGVELGFDGRALRAAVRADNEYIIL